MFPFLLVVFFGGVVYTVANRLTPAGARGIVALAMAAYVARLAVSLIQREIPFFSYGAGGDYAAYEDWARMIAKLWSFDGIHYCTSDDFPQMGRTTFPPNLFALIGYVNGEPSPIGSTSVIAALACLTGLNIFALATEFGVSLIVARRLMGTLLFLPSFLYYTSDAFKDGIVQFCVIAIVGCSLRLSRRFSLRTLAFAGVCFAVLYGSRFYLVYAAITPFVLGLVGLRSGAGPRVLVSVAALLIGLLVAVGLTGFSKSMVEEANTTFEVGTSQNVRADAARGGSGVDLDTATPAGFALALVYTLFAPFFWQPGSTALQLGKVDAIIWYFMAYRAARGGIHLWRSGRRPELMVLLSFIVPTTLAYAAGFANIGLTVRERLGVVMMCGLLGAIGAVPAAAGQEVRARARSGPQGLLGQRAAERGLR